MNEAKPWYNTEMVSQKGSVILTNWKRERESARMPVKNADYGQDIYEAFGISPSASGMAVNSVSAMRVSAVFACVGRISGGILTLPLDIYKTNGDVNAKIARDDLWYKLNEEPSTQYTAASLWEGVSVGQLLRGDSHAWIRRGLTGNIIEILPLPQGSVSPVRQSDGGVRYYISLPQYNITTWLEPYEVLHFPGFGFDGLKSQSVISHAAKAAVGNALAMDDYSGKFFSGGAHPSIVIEAPNKMGTDQITQLQDAFKNKYSGIQNAHQLPLVLTEGLKASEISLSAEDAQLLEARKFQVVDIARAFGVPPHMIGSSDASTSWGTGIESMNRGFVSLTLQPWLIKIEQELNRKLFPRNAGKFIKFNREAMLEGDSTAQANYNRAALGGPGTGMGWLTVDEVRKKEGRGPLGGTAAELFDPRSTQSEATKP